MYKYHAPATVLSPRDCVDEVIPIFDGALHNGAFSIAKVIWNGSTTIAVRWNVNQREWDDQNKINGSNICIGEPNSRGYATWFILPNELLKALLLGNGIIADGVRQALDEIESNNIL